MREILFRGKYQKGNKGWFYGAYIRHETRQICPIQDELKPEEVEHYIAQDSFADWNMPRKIELVPVIPDTVGQYTGLKDKYGKKIFEGDVMEDSLGQKGYISFSEEESEYEITSCGDGTPITVRFDWFDAMHGVIIGNIYDNPEFLE